ncbi:YqiJ family protein [Kordiimonas sp. SCSIO 12610]|uniref:YqiJ family protein n=1 Tax=Kordiimonas sp. SCSIO 12610 TaxID=2829597 RepID=UPI00210C5A58|nr:YqiJ family protein [Kordiimonas sp. SCSIO 12610]UTW54773.1 YqiJ family protein [Kordiimonas sp. SCSIO 12610]
MTVIELFLAPENIAFSVALGLVIAIGVLEGIGAVVGFALSGLLDSIFPEADIDLDAGDVGDSGAFGEFLSWLRFREVPVIVIMIAFLTAFGLTGIVFQGVLAAILGSTVNGFVASISSLLICLPVVRFFAGVLAKIMPKDETSAVKTDSFVGHSAKVVLGTMGRGNPAQIKLADQFGQDHYFMAEPDMDDASFNQGDDVIIVRKEQALFYVIANTKEFMTDD